MEHLDSETARSRILFVMAKHGLTKETACILRENGKRSIAEATPEQIRQAAVAALFRVWHLGKTLYEIRQLAAEEDKIISELAHAIGIIPITERHHYQKSVIPYKSKASYGK